MTTYFRLPLRAYPHQKSSEKAKEILNEHELYAAFLESSVNCLGSEAGLLCYCKCSSHTLEPWVDWLLLSDVRLGEPVKIFEPKQTTERDNLTQLQSFVGDLLGATS